MHTKQITIGIEGKDGKVDVRNFIDIVNNTVAALQQLEKDLSETKESHLKWKIEQVSMRSPIQLTLAGEVDTEESVLTVDPVTPFMKDMKKLETGTEQPEYLRGATLRIVERILSYMHNGIGSITFESPGLHAVKPTQQTTAHIGLLTASKIVPYSVLTQLDGRLEQISVHGGKSEFCIYDPLTDDRIRCEFDREKVKVEEVGSLITKRIRITGNVRFNEYYRPVFVKVDSFTRLREQSELPQISDLHKANISITGPQDSVSYIEDLRDAE